MTTQSNAPSQFNSETPATPTRLDQLIAEITANMASEYAKAATLPPTQIGDAMATITSKVIKLAQSTLDREAGEAKAKRDKDLETAKAWRSVAEASLKAVWDGMVGTLQGLPYVPLVTVFANINDKGEATPNVKLTPQTHPDFAKLSAEVKSWVEDTYCENCNKLIEIPKEVDKQLIAAAKVFSNQEKAMEVWMNTQAIKLVTAMREQVPTKPSWIKGITYSIPRKDADTFGGATLITSGGTTPRKRNTSTGNGGKRGEPLTVNGTEYPSARAAFKALMPAGTPHQLSRSAIIKRLRREGHMITTADMLDIIHKDY